MNVRMQHSCNLFMPKPLLTQNCKVTIQFMILHYQSLRAWTKWIKVCPNYAYMEIFIDVSGFANHWIFSGFYLPKLPPPCPGGRPLTGPLKRAKRPSLVSRGFTGLKVSRMLLNMLVMKSKVPSDSLILMTTIKTERRKTVEGLIVDCFW